MRWYEQLLIAGSRHLNGPHALMWLSGLLLGLLVKGLGIQFGGWLALAGLLVLSGWLPRLAAGHWFNHKFWLVWGLQAIMGLIWLPLGWGGLTATLQAGITLPATVQNAIFMTRYQWGPWVGVIWGLCWLASFKWLPSCWQQLQQPTTWKKWWWTGWQQAFWPVVWQVIKALRWLGIWLLTALAGVGLTWLVERSWSRVSPWVAGLVLVGLLWELLLLIVAGLTIQQPVMASSTHWSTAGLLVGLVLFASWWLSGPSVATPAIIAHRGVDGHNGVQNTTSVLKRTVKAIQPAQVEMDIQPTLDRQWVVMHDPTLDHLSQRHGPVRDYRLRQLANIPLWENGDRGQLSTFKAYLRVARQLKQPLLVEIKAIGPAANLMASFGHTYAQTLQQQHSQVHSLDYAVVTRLKQHDPQLKVGYITPFNLTSFRANAADFYSLQALTLTCEQVAAAKRQHKPVYVWTPDEAFLQQRLATMGVAGIITNQPGQLRRLLAAKPAVYTFRLINWLFNLL